MACGSCTARARARRNSKTENTRFVWTSADGKESRTYATKIEAAKKTQRRGGSWEKKEIQNG